MKRDIIIELILGISFVLILLFIAQFFPYWSLIVLLIMYGIIMLVDLIGRK